MTRFDNSVLPSFGLPRSRPSDSRRQSAWGRKSAAQGLFFVLVDTRGRSTECRPGESPSASSSPRSRPSAPRSTAGAGRRLQMLASYAERYAPVAEHAGISFPSTITFDVIERMPGGPTTASAAPECRRPFQQVAAEAERAKLPPAATRRLVGLLTAAWATFDEVAAASRSCAKARAVATGPGQAHRPRDRRRDAYARKLGVSSSSRPSTTSPRPSSYARRSPPWWAPRRTAHP